MSIMLLYVDDEAGPARRLAEAAGLEARAVAEHRFPDREQRNEALLIGPDAESRQWVQQAASATGFAFGVCHKTRHGDREVAIALPEMALRGRRVVLMDDVASTGHTVARAAEALLAGGAASVDLAVTHALFADDALAVIEAAGVGEVWSTDCIVHASNAIPMAPLLAPALTKVLGALY
ncbi:phosphoribosyltransferase family protein [Halomonas salina]|uniref:phosphoribosyltransferase family protein n=1 Tax=Halomonas salina TaxID=42565 RepID=UPI00068CBFA0|nr:phosphoribosyltransferase family protein [Halomonas salina]